MDPSDIQHRFAFHKANETTGPIHERIREACGELAFELDELMTDGREKALVMTKLEEAMMWSNAAVARESGG